MPHDGTSGTETSDSPYQTGSSTNLANESLRTVLFLHRKFNCLFTRALPNHPPLGINGIKIKP